MTLHQSSKQPTNRISKFMQSVQRDYGHGVYSDLAKIMNCSSGAFSRMGMNNNGVTYKRAQMLAFLFDVSLDDMADTGKFKHPSANTAQVTTEDLIDLSETVMVVSSKFKCIELAADLRRVAQDYLNSVKPKQTEMDLKPKSVPDPVPVVAETMKAANDRGDKNAIRLILHQAEKFRQANNIEWVIKEDGSLGAKRVIVEEF